MERPKSAICRIRSNMHRRSRQGPVVLPLSAHPSPGLGATWAPAAGKDAHDLYPTLATANIAQALQEPRGRRVDEGCPGRVCGGSRSSGSPGPSAHAPCGPRMLLPTYIPLIQQVPYPGKAFFRPEINFSHDALLFPKGHHHPSSPVLPLLLSCQYTPRADFLLSPSLLWLLVQV